MQSYFSTVETTEVCQQPSVAVKEITTDLTNVVQTQEDSVFSVEGNVHSPNCSSNQSSLSNLSWIWKVYTVDTATLEFHQVYPRTTSTTTTNTSQTLEISPNSLSQGLHWAAVFVKQRGYYGTPSVAGGFFAVVPSSQEISGYFQLTNKSFSLSLLDETSSQYLDLRNRIELAVSNSFNILCSFSLFCF